MTKEQAIAELTRCADICPTTPLAEACRMGADALKGCDTCRYEAMDAYEKCAYCTNEDPKWELQEDA